MTVSHKIVVPSAANSASREPWKELALLLFGSAGAGIMAVILLLSAVLVVVGLYVQLIWPLTDWDLVSVSMEQYNSAAKAILIGVFLGGFSAGFWCISGNAWKKASPTPALQKAPAKPKR